MKTCNDCGVSKPLSDYYRKGSGHKHICKPCHKEYMRKRNATEHAKELNRRNARRYRYGLTDSELDEMLGGSCEICGEEGECVDHCHSTGRVRGWLCHACNQTLGKMKDRPDLLRKAAEYLEEH